MTHRAQPLPSLRSRALRRRGESGAAIVEFALVAGLFMMLLYGFIAYGLAVSLKQRVTNAAAAGARAAVGATDPVAAATATAQDAMGGCTGTCTVTVPLPAACGGTAPGQCITVTVRSEPKVQDGMNLVVPDFVESTAKVQIS